MQQINQFLIFEFGAKVRAFLDLPDGPTLRELSTPLFELQTILGNLAGGSPVELAYSMGNIKAALEQLNFLEKIGYHNKEGNFDFDKDWTKPASPFGVTQVKEALTKLEHTLAAEFEKTATYLVSKTNSFDTETLIERAIETFPPEVRAELNEMARFDFKEAGKCLGFGLFTAAGFHLARATEAVMADYCRTFEVEVTKKSTWGTLLGALSACTGDVVPDKSTISILEQIKNVDRNDLMHPRKTLSLTDATRLFHLATGAIIAMTLEIRSKAEKAAQGALVLEAPSPALLPQSLPQPIKTASKQ